MKPMICCCLVAKSCPTLLQPQGQQPAMLLCPWDFPGKNTGGGCHLLLQLIFLTQGSNPRLLHWQADSSPLRHQGSPKPMIYTTYSKRQNWSLRTVYLLLPTSVTKESFPNFLFTSRTAISKVDDYKWEVWSQMKNTTTGLCCPDENPAGKSIAKPMLHHRRLCIHHCSKHASDTNSLLAYKIVYLT